MAVIETWFEQDLQKPVKVRYIDGNLFSHNGNGNRIGVIVTNNGEAVTLTGTVSGYAVLADGTTVPCTGTRSGNKASILVPAAAYSPGSILISIFLTDGTTVTTLAALSSSVIMARTGNQIDPGSVVTDWTNTINAAMQSVETAAANLGNIVATPYANLTFPVPLGKYTIYNNGLYRCISPIASSEAWTAAHWTNVKLGDDVADIKRALDNVSIYAKTRIFNWQEGYRIATNATVIDLSAVYPSPNYSCQIIEVSKGEKFKLTAHASNAIYNAYCFTDASRNSLRVSGPGTFQDYEITAPETGYLIVCTDDRTYQGLISEEVLSSLIEDNQQNKEEIAEINYKLESTESITFPETFFEQGGFGSSGSETESIYAIRTKDKILTTRPVSFIPHSGYRVFVVQYTKDGIYESQTGWQTATQTVPADKQFRYAISHATPTQEMSIDDHGMVIPAGSTYDEILIHNAVKNANSHSWEIREELLKYFANIFGTESNAYGKLYFVGQNETYTTINSALTVWAADNYPNATIYIRNGEYNETVEVEGKTIRFIGESRDGTIIHTTTGNYVNPPFNVRHGNVTLKNMTLIADHSENPDFDYEATPHLKAYGIHIDGGTVGGIVSVENCTIVSFQAPAVGTGTIPNSKIRLIDCDCYCYTDYTSDASSAQAYQLGLGCILWHSSNAEVYPVRGEESFELVNVKAYMKNNYQVFRVNRSNDTDSMDTLAINTLLLSGRNPYNQNPVSGYVHPIEGSIGNSESVLNYNQA